MSKNYTKDQIDKILSLSVTVARAVLYLYENQINGDARDAIEDVENYINNGDSIQINDVDCDSSGSLTCDEYKKAAYESGMSAYNCLQAAIAHSFANLNNVEKFSYRAIASASWAVKRYKDGSGHFGDLKVLADVRRRFTEITGTKYYI